MTLRNFAEGSWVSDVVAFLTDERETILRAAEAALARMHARHYETAGAEEVQRRLACFSTSSSAALPGVT
jgi:hypothetical protein